MKALPEPHKEIRMVKLKKNETIELVQAPPAFEERGQATRDELQEVNLG